ncbi:MAG: protease inhibitor I42 family protein [Anaerolineaceae bacterium]|nr:protease inhibitor I42 family protein [Anaerolineaceae bacterium]
MNRNWLYVLVFLAVVLILLFGLIGKKQEEKIEWEYTLRLPSVMAGDQAALEKRLKTALEDRDVRLKVKPETMLERGMGAAVGQTEISLRGVSERSEYQKALFSDLSGEINFLGGNTYLKMEGGVREGETYQLRLEANPSTGYVWKLMTYDSSLLMLVSGTSFSQRRELPGSPVVQEFAFTAQADGAAVVELVYQRGWEKRRTVDRSLVLTGESLRDLIDLTDPQPEVLMTERSVGVESAAGTYTQEIDPAELPVTFDLRDEISMTPVSNQGACGSCWAFASVATMENAIIYRGGTPHDFSEQFLLDCNTDGWSCLGGWRAHPYHVDKLGKNQSEIGAVLEADAPYQGVEKACNSVYAHPYQLNEWGYLISNWRYALPDELLIKQAIYEHGPLTVSICAGSAFASYSGGIFETDESGDCMPYLSNHSVSLVGWNDVDDTWILRNTWGADWGLNGYMRIRRGVSNVGFAASYVIAPDQVVEDPTPVEKVTLLEPPNNELLLTFPLFAWEPLEDVDEYDLIVEMEDGSSLVYERGAAADYCGEDRCEFSASVNEELLPGGAYRWRVKAYRGESVVESDWFGFFIKRLLKLPAQLSSPGGVVHRVPVYQWRASTDAVRFDLVILTQGEPEADQWPLGDDAVRCVESVEGEQLCSVDSPEALSDGRYEWMIRSWFEDDTYLDSSWLSFDYESERMGFFARIWDWLMRLLGIR